jgi:hypothetical protein
MKTRIKWAGGLLALLGLLGLPVRADQEEAVRTAVERGVAYLKNQQSHDGTWFFGGRSLDADHDVGVAALVGLALLESGVPGSDPVIDKAAQLVRDRMPFTIATYDLSLAVLFLDRLGRPEDERLLEAGSLSLAAGQTAEGGWGYTCPPAQGEEEVRRLRTRVEEKNGNKGDGSRAAAERRPASGSLRTNRLADVRQPFGDDNSNTQFATLALWVARRHHLTVDRTLAAVDSRFRKTQNTDGGWGYKPLRGMGSTASMTCAGLLGLAVGEGVSRQAVLRTKAKAGGSSRAASLPDPKQDGAVRGAFGFLSRMMEAALEVQPEAGPGLLGPGGGFGGRRGGFGRGGFGGRGNLRDNGLGSEYYFLWSLERVAVVYGQNKIGARDWFAIGSQFLLRKQQNDGSWSGNLGATVDTCFALFFLRRANLALDLTATLRGSTRPEQAANMTAKDARREVAADSGAGPGEETTERPPAQPAAPGKSIPALAEKQPPPEPATVAGAPPSAALPPASASPEKESARLGEQLLQAAPAEQVNLLRELQDGKGAAYTDALAAAIPRLSGEARTQACDALAERLGRMKPATLRDKCRDSNLEVRRAAALACAARNDQAFVPDLIRLLGDPEPRVCRAARAALKSLTTQDFGPDDTANVQTRYDVVTRWREWWTKKSGP